MDLHQQQQLLLAAALWPAQRAAVLEASGNSNNNNNTGVLLAHIHPDTPSAPSAPVLRQLLHQPHRVFDLAQGLPLAALAPGGLDQLAMAAYFHQMVERLQSAEQFGPQQQPQGQAPPTLSNSSSSSSSASSGNPEEPGPGPVSVVVLNRAKNETNDNAAEQPEQAEDREVKPPATVSFVPTPATSADELVGHALTRIVEQSDAEYGSNSNANVATTMTMTQTSMASSNGDEGATQEGPSTAELSGENISIDGVLLCRVCSDKASGYHYGIFSCEGCKGFFRRSLQNKIDYRPCTQGQKCQIVRANRNRCQECRWRKCIEAGMSKDNVRYGRVPKREKEKLREEMRRDSARSAMEQLGAELEDENAIVEQLESAFAELGADMRMRLQAKACVPDACARLLDARAYLDMTRWVVQFATRIRGFRLLRREERVRLIRDAHFPVLLLRLCTLRVPSASEAAGAPAPVELAAVPGCLQIPPQHGTLRERIVEFVHRIREAQPPAELCPTERQLALISALCLCRTDGGGAGESAAGASAGAADDHAAHLQLAIARRIHERLWQALNGTLGQGMLPFGPSLLRRDSMERQHLAALLEALRQLRTAHRHALTHTQCRNVPAELFIVPPAENNGNDPSPPKNRDRDESAGGGQKRRKVAEAAPEVKPTPMSNGRSVNNARTVNNKNIEQPQQQQHQEQQRQQIAEELPTLRRALERPPVVAPVPVYPPTVVQLTPHHHHQTHAALRELLARPPMTRVPPVVAPPPPPQTHEQEQPLNLCVRDRVVRHP